MQGPRHAHPWGLHFTGLLQGRTPGSSQERWAGVGGPQCPSQSRGCRSSLTLERVSQAQLPGPMVTVATGPACPGPLLSPPQAPQQVLGMPVNTLMWGRARVCLWTCVSANTLHEWAHVYACEVTASALLNSHPTLVSTWCLLFPQIDVPMLAPCPKVPTQFRGN